MKVIDLLKLDNIDFFVKNLFAMPQYWQKVNVFNTLMHPKTNDAFLYFKKVSGKYEFDNGATLNAQPGDLIYIPFGARYRTEFIPSSHSLSECAGADTLLVNFRLFDENGSFVLSEQVTKLASDRSEIIEATFMKVLDCGARPQPQSTKFKSAFFSLMSAIIMINNCDDLKNTVFKRIRPGIDYLQNDSGQQMSIEELAKLCNMSASLFRRIFAKYAGMPPLEYRNMRKIERAKALLASGMYNVSETGDQLGFEDAAYFSRFFKRSTGLSPREFIAKTNDTDLQ